MSLVFFLNVHRVFVTERLARVFAEELEVGWNILIEDGLIITDI